MGGRIAPGALLIRRGRITRWSGTAGSRARHIGPSQRLGIPKSDGDGERPVLLAQALPVTVHGDVAQEPAGLPRLVRLALPGQPGARQTGADHKGGRQYPDG